MIATELPVLLTPRLRLRPLLDTDTDALFEVFSDERVMRYWSRPPMREYAEAVQYLAELSTYVKRGDLQQWGIELPSEGQIIGTCTLFQVNWAQGRAEIGYILNSRFWRQGIANEALSRLLDHARDDLRLRRIEADVDPRNLASLKCLERLGFVHEGLMHERWLVAGELQDAAVLGLLLRNWRA